MQYTSDIFEKYLASNKIRHSYSRKDCSYDNACIESFHSLIKKEEIYRCVYKDSKEAYDSIFEYIESWYNRQRTHSSFWLAVISWLIIVVVVCGCVVILDRFQMVRKIF